MNETWLRWKARIGSLKAVALLVLMFSSFGVIVVGQNISRALKNPEGSESAAIRQLVTGEIKEDRYVTVSGLAVYELGYQETEDGKLEAIFYPLIDQDQGCLVFVRTSHTELLNQADTVTTISGLTKSAPSDLRDLIHEDMSGISSSGLSTIETLYIEEGLKPSSLLIWLAAAAALLFLLALCAVTFFFPSTVFAAFPLQPIDPSASTTGETRASGSFRQLKSKLPALDFGTRRMKFDNSVSNLFSVEGSGVGIYIHLVQTSRVNGIPVARRETHWAVILKPTQVTTVEPGKVYGWRDRWAVSLRYRDENNKEQKLIISFENASAQASFVNFLRSKGFPVSSGMFAQPAIAPT